MILNLTIQTRIPPCLLRCVDPCTPSSYFLVAFQMHPAPVLKTHQKPVSLRYFAFFLLIFCLPAALIMSLLKRVLFSATGFPASVNGNLANLASTVYRHLWFQTKKNLDKFVNRHLRIQPTLAIVCSSRDETGMEDQRFVSRRNCESTRMCWTLRGKEALAGGDRSAKRFGISRKITRTAFFYIWDLCSGSA